MTKHRSIARVGSGNGSVRRARHAEADHGAPQRNWTKAGASYTNGSRGMFSKWFAALEWIPMPAKVRKSSGLLIGLVVDRFEMEHLTAVAESATCPFSLVGIEREHDNGVARVYAIRDRRWWGVVCSDFLPGRG